MNTELIHQISLSSTMSILSALKQMDRQKRKLLIVEECDGTFKSLLSIGDIQRAIISNVPLSSSISEILRSEVHVASVKDNMDQIRIIMRERRNEFMPVIDEEKHIVDVIFWEDIIKDETLSCDEKFDLPVVVMAGGIGSRLRPLTNVLPKPLIPIGEKTMLEDIMDRFVECGSNKFYISVNYKADFIKNYFLQLNNNNYCVTFFQEDKPLGTAGSLKLLEGEINSTFFVSNCDILINDDYSHLLKYHKENKNDITLVTALKNYPIPYGLVETSENGLLTAIKEKPEISFQINTGLYILEPNMIDLIPNDEFFHITHLMEKVIKHGGRVGCFPVSEKSWVDVGDWKEYKKIIEQ